ncbi:MAG: hypothetical protein O3B01_25235 [Planctomycetota bacterium]|nr:hypothetical protein [Planctomycetota bacterium]MDA1141881.1 hypothetical protein [Planctomycetota bacterium]
MACNGHKILKSPHFDAMAAEPLRFDRSYAAAPVCSPWNDWVVSVVRSLNGKDYN